MTSDEQTRQEPKKTDEEIIEEEIQKLKNELINPLEKKMKEQKETVEAIQKLKSELLDILQEENQKIVEFFQFKIDKLEKMIYEQQIRQEVQNSQNSVFLEYLAKYKDNSSLHNRERQESSVSFEKIESKQQKNKITYLWLAFMQAIIVSYLVIFIVIFSSSKDLSAGDKFSESFRIITSFTAGFLGVASLAFLRRSLD